MASTEYLTLEMQLKSVSLSVNQLWAAKDTTCKTLHCCGLIICSLRKEKPNTSVWFRNSHHKTCIIQSYRGDKEGIRHVLVPWTFVIGCVRLSLAFYVWLPLSSVPLMYSSYVLVISTILTIHFKVRGRSWVGFCRQKRKIITQCQ